MLQHKKHFTIVVGFGKIFCTFATNKKAAIFLAAVLKGGIYN
jgi:hypothetical protein